MFTQDRVYARHIANFLHASLKHPPHPADIADKLSLAQIAAVIKARTDVSPARSRYIPPLNNL